MPANKNALIRYRTIDRCLRNRYRRWTLDDLVDACSDALYDMEGIAKGVSVRTVQGDLQIMRSDKLGYYAPIEVYDNKYYRYADPDYSITNTPVSTEDYNYNPQNEMFRKNKTKRSAPQNEMFLFRVPSPLRKNASDFSGAFPFSQCCFKRSNQTSHSRRRQAAGVCVPDCSRIYVCCQGSVLCFSMAGLSAEP